MSEPLKITANINAFNTSTQWLRYDELLAKVRKANAGESSPESVFAYMAVTPSDMKGIEGWSLVGRAEVTVTFFPREQIVTEELKSLNAQLDRARAEWLTKQQELLERISKLQAITNEVDA